MYKTLSLLLFVGAIFLGCADKSNKPLKMFQSVKIDEATILQSGENRLSCCKCGMNLPMFFKTNHVAHEKGKIKQYCSIHCLEKDLKDGAKLDDIKVVDTKTLKFIPAKNAYYVVGSSKKATMSKVSKYAFANKNDAKDFAKKFGGKILSFKEALEVAKRDFQR